MASNWPPVKNVAFTMGFFIYKNDGTIIANPTLTGSNVHKDLGTTEVTDSTLAVVDTTTGLCSIALAQGTMNADQIDGTITSSSTGAVVYTFKLMTAAQTLDTTDAAVDTAVTNIGTVDTVVDGIETHVHSIDTTKMGTITNTGGTATIGAILGDFANTTLTTRVADLHTDVGTVDTVVDALAVSLAALGTTEDVAAAVLDHDVTTHTTASTVGKYVNDLYAGVVTDAAGTNVGADTTELLTRLPDATAGAAGGVFIAGSNAATTVNFTGNLSGSVGSVTAEVTANVTKISGDATAADNAESFFDGTGYAGTNNVIPLVTTTTTATNLTNLPAAAATAAELAKVPKSDSTVSWNATALAAINAEVDTALNTAIPGSPTADSINERMATLDDHITADYGTTERAAIALLDDANGLVDIHDTIVSVLADTNELQTDWANGGRLDLLLDAAGTGADPWTTALPGAYGAGTAGLILGTQGATAIPTAATISDTVWDEASASHASAGSTGKALTDANNGTPPTASAVASQVRTELTTELGRIDAAVSTRLATTGYTTPPTATENADALLNRDMSAVSDTTSRSPLNALRALRNKVAISGATMTVYEENDSTSAWTATVTSDSTADPITVVDPA